METLCPNKELCGSCGWSHIPYAKQLIQKLSDINFSLKLHQIPFECKAIIPSPKTNHYRNRMDFVIDFEGKVGLRQKGKWWKVIDDHTCFIADSHIEDLFHIVRDWVNHCELSFYDRKKFIGLLRYAVIRYMQSGQSMITIVTSKPIDNSEMDHIKSKLIKLSDLTKSTTLIWAINETTSDTSHGGTNQVIAGPGYITETINGFKYYISPDSFFQTNSYTSPILMDTVINMSGDISNQTVVDLYCGSGFFSFPLANKAKQVIGVESVQEAILDAKQSNLLNKTTINFICDKSENFNLGEYRPDILIVDPPRTGLSQTVINSILEVKPQTLIYVSCDYKRFSENSKQLLKNYSISEITAIDMFPHTPHVELVTKFQIKE